MVASTDRLIGGRSVVRRQNGSADDYGPGLDRRAEASIPDMQPAQLCLGEASTEHRPVGTHIMHSAAWPEGGKNTRLIDNACRRCGPVVASRGPMGQLSNRLPTACGLAL
jgi:hypothetical protein